MSDVSDEHAPDEVSSSTVAATLNFVLSNGLTIEEAAAATGMTCRELIQPDARVPDTLVHDLMAAMVRCKPDLPLPIAMAASSPMSYLAGLENVIQFAPSVRDALLLISECSELIASRVSIELEESNALGAYIIRHPNDYRDNGNAGLTGMALLWRFILENCVGTEGLVEVRSGFERLGLLAAHTNFFKATVTFNNPESALVMTRKLLDTPMRKANTTVFESMREHYRRVVAQLTTTAIPARMTRLQRATSQSAANAEYDVSSIASHAHMSVRTAQRVAAANGTSLRAILDDARADRAKRLFLSDPDIRVSSVAIAVGYSDSRAFRRAFRRWTGMSPTDFRRLCLADGR
ncbi:MAG: helix-turn-helix domain-containing protein [Pseudomonadota bacterium]|mgnify:CR=1 FL=1